MGEDEEVAAILHGWADQIARAVLSMPEMQALAKTAWLHKRAREFGESVGEDLAKLLTASPAAREAASNVLGSVFRKRSGNAEDGS